MNTWQRRTIAYLGWLVALTTVFTFGYNRALRRFEGENQPLYQSFQFIVETFTATGYGSESPWATLEMNLIVAVIDVVGFASVFLAIPVLLVPLLESAISTTVPTAVEDGLSDHVVVAAYSSRAEMLIEELEARDVEYVVVEPDRELATDLYEDETRVIRGDPQSVEALRNANLAAARAVVADGGDDVNTSVILTAREVVEEITVVSVVEDPERARYHDLAGADAVLSPRGLLGQSLASKVTTDVSTDLGDTIEVGEDFEIAEFPIHRGSDLVGQTLAESEVRHRTGANVIGAWFRGQFESPPSPSATIDDGTVLLAAGTEAQLEGLRDLTLSDVRDPGRGETLVVGYGEVGATAAGALESAGVPHTVIDLDEQPGVDVVGDGAEPGDLRRAGIRDARTVVLALPDDTTTEVATLVVRDLNPDAEIVARAQEDENVRKMYRAGADYVLSLATVSGRMLASAILDEETVVSPDTQVEVVRTAAPGLVGQTLGAADVRARTGCTVVAVERDGEVLTDVGPEFRIRRGDELVVAGTDAGVNRFTELAT
jgi:Trk K+ transport system NAD-binding subunit